MLFVSKTLQKSFKRSIVTPLFFEGSVISYCKQQGGRGRPSMGISILEKRKGMIQRESASQGSKWKILVVRHGKVRLVGVNASPSASPQHWRGITEELKIPRAK